MRPLVFIATFTMIFCATAQQEAANWCLNPNSLLDFNTTPPILSYGNPFTTFETAAAISDENGNLLFYTDGDTVRGADGSVLPNGDDVSFIPAGALHSTTQGALFLKKPGSQNLYYLFSLGYKFGQHNALFSYSVLDKNLNGGLGDVVSKYNFLCNDTLAEKLTATRHCNGKDYWIVIVKCIPLQTHDGIPVVYDTEFQSYLLTENGVQPSPVKTRLHTNCTRFGQMKFNNAGDELAFAENSSLTLLAFDRSTGMVSIKTEYTLPLENGYGLEYSPNDLFVYVDQQQVELSTGVLTSLYPNYPSQLQRGLDGKIYSIRLTPQEGWINDLVSPYIWYYSNSWGLVGTNDGILNIDVIEQPDLPGTTCLYSTDYLTLARPEYFNEISVSLPNFPSFVFNHKVSDFSYTGTCEGDSFQFSLSDPAFVPDSIQWVFHDDGTTTALLTPTHQYDQEGNWEVTCTVYLNGIPHTTTHCVVVCGPGAIQLPALIDLCKTPAPFELNPLTTCANQYVWSTGDTTSAITISDVGAYTLQATGACGTHAYTVEVIEGDDCTVLTEIPNVITVNGDYTNEFFAIDVKNATSFVYRIINRWGNLVCDGTVQIPAHAVFAWNTFPLWDGKTTDGEPVSDGVYFYNIDFTLSDGSVSTRQGFVEVFRQ